MRTCAPMPILILRTEFDNFDEIIKCKIVGICQSKCVNRFWHDACNLRIASCNRNVMDNVQVSRGAHKLWKETSTWTQTVIFWLSKPIYFWLIQAVSAVNWILFVAKYGESQTPHNDGDDLFISIQWNTHIDPCRKWSIRSIFFIRWRNYYLCLFGLTGL